MINNDLDLPFEYHLQGKPPTALIFTTEPDGEDRIQCDVLATLESDNNDNDGDRTSDLAAFLTTALNAYVGTPEGLEHWKRGHPLMAQMRQAGRQ